MSRVVPAIFWIAAACICLMGCAGSFGLGLWVERIYADRQLNAMRIQFQGDMDAAVAQAHAQGYADDQEIAQYNFSRGAFAWCVESGGDPFDCNEDVQAWWQIRWQVWTEGFIWRNP